MIGTCLADFIMVRDKEIPSETGYMAAPTRFITELKKALHSGSVHISYLRYVLDVIADWPINRVSELLPWRITLPTE
ncbi:hypothetical protein AOY81_23190 [Escherichia coli]|nr:hypothetical protein AOY81_23190 [Escherichia coli]